MSLPPLRADLQLSAAAPGHDGAPQWTLADPLRGRYFKLGAAAVRLLQHWRLGDPQRVLAAANAEPGQAVDGQALEELLSFLGQHDLISAEDARQRDSYATKAAATRQSLWTRVLHQYLFFRIPLWRPDAFLNRTWPLLERHAGWLLRIALPLLLTLGVFLVIRDWSRFVATFPHLFSLGASLPSAWRWGSPSCATSLAMPSWPSVPAVGCRAWAWRSWCCCRCSTPMSAMPGASVTDVRGC